MRYATTAGKNWEDRTEAIRKRESLDTGRTLAKLTCLAKEMRNMMKKGELDVYEDEGVRIDMQIREANDIIGKALQASGIEMNPSRLAEVISEAPAIAHDAMDYKALLRAESLRESLERDFVNMNILPPKAAWVDGSDKPFCRLERRQLRDEAEAAAKAAANGVDAGGVDVNSVNSANGDADSGLHNDMYGGEYISDEELEARRAAMIATTDVNRALDGYNTVLLEVRRVHKVHKGGTTMTMRALVAIGDGAGTAGYGEGKSSTTNHAVERACRDALRNLLTLQRKEERTIHHRVKGKYVKSQVSLWPAPPGTGVSANNNFTAIFALFGLKDIGAKLHGPRSLTNAVKALFNALSRVHTPESISAVRGVPVYATRRAEKLGLQQLTQ